MRVSETILVVEDEGSVRKLTKDVLNKYGYTVLTAIDGQEGLDRYAENEDMIDLVLLDLKMPGMSGDMVLKRLLEMKPDIKVIISSGYISEDAREGILSKAKEFIRKPYHMGDLLKKIKTVLNK